MLGHIQICKLKGFPLLKIWDSDETQKPVFLKNSVTFLNIFIIVIIREDDDKAMSEKKTRQNKTEISKQTF